MLIEVTKILEFPDRTISTLSIDGNHFCFVLEDGYKEEKVPGETRIEGGIYNIVKRTFGGFFKDYNQKFGHKFSIQIENVPGFEDVLIHIGNFPENTRGCLLIAFDLATTQTNAKIQLQRSTDCYKIFYSLVSAAFRKKEQVQIRITR